MHLRNILKSTKMNNFFLFSEAPKPPGKPPGP